MMTPDTIFSVAALLGIGIVAFAGLRGWQGWLALKERELERLPREVEHSVGTGGARIGIAALKERIRKLEAIASGVEL